MFFVHADRADLSAPLVRMVCQLCGEMTDPGDLAQARHLLVCRRASEELREAAREAERRSLSPSLDLRGRQCGHLTVIRETKRTIVIRGYCVRTWLARCACTRQFLVRTGALLFDGVDRCPSCAKAARDAAARGLAAPALGGILMLRKIFATPLLIFGRLLQARIYQDRCRRLEEQLRAERQEADKTIARHVRERDTARSSYEASEHNRRDALAKLDATRDENRRLLKAIRARTEVWRDLDAALSPLGTAPGGIDLPDVPSLPGSDLGLLRRDR